MDLRRITDLFVEGTELFLGTDDKGPIILWVNKLNPFQAQEAVKDGQARRFIAMSRLKDSGEFDGFKAELSMMSHDELAIEYVNGCSDDIALAAMDDLDIDAELKEMRENAERLESIVADAGTAKDAPDHGDISAFHETWLKKYSDLQVKKGEEFLRDAKALERGDLEDKFTEKWRFHRTQEAFVSERRMTEVYFALRQCKGVQLTVVVDGKLTWDHSACDHTQRYLSERKDVHDLPDQLLQLIGGALEAVSVPARAAGNSDALGSSSASSEPSSAPEEVSKPSFPDETPSAAPTT